LPLLHFWWIADGIREGRVGATGKKEGRLLLFGRRGRVARRGDFADHLCRVHIEHFGQLEDRGEARDVAAGLDHAARGRPTRRRCPARSPLRFLKDSTRGCGDELVGLISDLIDSSVDCVGDLVGGGDWGLHTLSVTSLYGSDTIDDPGAAIGSRRSPSVASRRMVSLCVGRDAPRRMLWCGNAVTALTASIRAFHGVTALQIGRRPRPVRPRQRQPFPTPGNLNQWRWCCICVPL